jgi:hypothetical protein
VIWIPQRGARPILERGWPGFFLDLVMKLEEKAIQVLDPKKLSLPEKPKVVEIRVKPYVDHLGDDALEVWVILAEGTTRKDRDPQNTLAIRRTIGDALLDAGIDLFPYSHLVMRSELEEAGMEV